MEQDCETGIKLIVKAKERQEESRQWQLYCSAYPHFTKDNFVQFDEFYKKKNVKVSLKPKEDIIDEVKRMRQKHGWK